MSSFSQLLFVCLLFILWFVQILFKRHIYLFESCRGGRKGERFMISLPKWLKAGRASQELHLCLPCECWDQAGHRLLLSLGHYPAKCWGQNKDRSQKELLDGLKCGRAGKQVQKCPQYQIECEPHPQKLHVEVGQMQKWLSVLTKGLWLSTVEVAIFDLALKDA